MKEFLISLAVMVIISLLLLGICCCLRVSSQEERNNERQRLAALPRLRDIRAKIYLSGAITGNPDYMAQFDEAEKELTAKGWRVLNPAKTSATLPATSYLVYMQLSLVQMQDASAIYMLQGWERSPGAVFEKHVAESMGYAVIFQEAKANDRKRRDT